MNPWQMAQQIKHELAQARWEKGSREQVFGDCSVYVYAGAPPTEEELPAGFPFAMVTIDSATADGEDPELLQQTFSVVVAAEVAGDPLGENAVIGGARNDLGSSAGAGVAEVAERARFAIQRINSIDGASIQISSSGIGAPTALGRGRHLAYSEFTVSAWCTSQPFYAAPQEVTVQGTGTWRWKGQHCKDRFDFVEFRIAGAPGLDPVIYTETDADIWAGTELTTTAGVAAGSTYAVYAAYDGHGRSTASAFSLPEVGSWITA